MPPAGVATTTAEARRHAVTRAAFVYRQAIASISLMMADFYAAREFEVLMLGKLELGYCFAFIGIPRRVATTPMTASYQFDALKRRR